MCHTGPHSPLTYSKYSPPISDNARRSCQNVKPIGGGFISGEKTALRKCDAIDEELKLQIPTEISHFSFQGTFLNRPLREYLKRFSDHLLNIEHALIISIDSELKIISKLSIVLFRIGIKYRQLNEQKRE